MNNIIITNQNPMVVTPLHAVPIVPVVQPMLICPGAPIKPKHKKVRHVQPIPFGLPVEPVLVCPGAPRKMKIHPRPVIMMQPRRLFIE